jgi:hypothetical protein
MTIQELERQLLTLDRNERIRIIQVMAQSLAIPSQEPRTSNLDQTSIVDFFRNSPLNHPTVHQSDRETVAYSLAALDDQTVIRLEVPAPT